MTLYLEITLEFANIVIAVFAFIYGVLFIYRTVHHKHKLPWILLTIGMLLFAFFQLFMLLRNFFVDVQVLQTIYLILGTAFSSIILLSFVMQTDLIFKFPYILIEKKGASSEVGLVEKCVTNASVKRKAKSRSKKRKR